MNSSDDEAGLLALVEHVKQRARHVGLWVQSVNKHHSHGGLVVSGVRDVRLVIRDDGRQPKNRYGMTSKPVYGSAVVYIDRLIIVTPHDGDNPCSEYLSISWADPDSFVRLDVALAELYEELDKKRRVRRPADVR